MANKVEGAVVLVTGSNRGIGRAIAEALLTRGAAKVYASARKTEALQALAESHPERLVPVTLDITDATQIQSAAQIAQDVQIVINNAGVARNAALVDAELSVVRKEFEVNYFGALQMTQAFAPILAQNGGGAIVNVNSVGGLVPSPMFPTYCDTKAALHSLTVNSRLVLGQQGITVYGVYPGPIETDMSKNVPLEKASAESAANEILDALDAGQVDVFPDPMSKQFSGPYEAGAKTLENQMVAMMQQMSQG